MTKVFSDRVLTNKRPKRDRRPSTRRIKRYKRSRARMQRTHISKSLSMPIPIARMPITEIHAGQQCFSLCTLA